MTAYFFPLFINLAMRGMADILSLWWFHYLFRDCHETI